MNTRRATLMEVIYPRLFPSNSKRAQAMRTITQPDIEGLEQTGAGLAEGWRTESPSAHAASSRAPVAHRGGV